MIRRRCTGRGVCGTQLRASRFVTTVRCRHRPARGRRHRLACMSFRVLVIGGRRFCDNARLRDALDRALVNRLPDVELLTAGGPGVAALAASYARTRGLTLTVLTTDYIRYPGDAREHRDGQLVALADAAVVVWEDGHGDVWELLGGARAKRIPLVILGAPARGPASVVDEGPRSRRPGAGRGGPGERTQGG